MISMVKKEPNEYCGSMPRKSKKQISLTIDEQLLVWIDKEVAEFTFANRSSAIEQAIFKLKKEFDLKKE